MRGLLALHDVTVDNPVAFYRSDRFISVLYQVSFSYIDPTGAHYQTCSSQKKRLSVAKFVIIPGLVIVYTCFYFETIYFDSLFL